MILVTGASQGIGYECATALLARTDERLLITGRDAGKLLRAWENVPDPSRERLTTRVCDQARRSDVNALIALLVHTDPPVTGAILGVGVNPMYTEGPHRIHAQSLGAVESTIQTNCTHTLMLTAALLGLFRARRSGTLVWIGSQAAKAGLPGAGVYCATKSFLAGLAQVAHNEYADRGVRVHLVNPGLVRTPRTADVVDRFSAAHGVAVSGAAETAAQIVDLYLAGAAAPVEVNL